MLLHNRTDNISLANAIQCILASQEFATDAAKPTGKYHFPDQDPAFEELLLGLMEGRISARGNLAWLISIFLLLKDT